MKRTAKRKRRSGWITLSHLRSIESDKIVRDRAIRRVPIIEPEAYVQPLAHIYRRLLSEKHKTDDVNVTTVADALRAWAHAHRFRFTDDQIIPRAARTAVERPRLLSADGVAKAFHLSYEERQRIGVRTIGAFDVSREERAQIQRDDYNQRRREQYARERDKRGGMTREEYRAQSKSQQEPWKAEGISRRTWYRRQSAVAQVIGSIKKERKSYACKRQPVPHRPEPAAHPLRGRGLPMMVLPVMLGPTPAPSTLQMSS